MLIPRIIPCLLLRNRGLVKTVKFGDGFYVGDPINAIKIFNEKGVDELIFLDIDATAKNKEIDFDLLEQITNECFMPFCYGGGVQTLDDVKKIFDLGVEKVAINSLALSNSGFVTKVANIVGSQSIIVSIDIKCNMLNNYDVFSHVDKKNLNIDPLKLAIQMQELGAGELLINCVDRDGTMEGYALGFINKIASAVSIPVIALGGAGKLSDFKDVVVAGASAASAGSMFVFYGKHKAVLINYPQAEVIKRLFQE